MDRLGININDASNGVAVTGPQKGGTQDLFSVNHRGSGLHSQKMANYLYENLKIMKNTKDAKEFLKATALAIKDGSIVSKAGLK